MFAYFSLNPQLICFKGKSIEHISQHADHKCVQLSKNEKFLIIQNLQKRCTTLEDMNNTSVANTAYIALHSPEPYNIYAKQRFDEMMSLIELL